MNLQTVDFYKTIREVAREQADLSKELDETLDAKKMTGS